MEFKALSWGKTLVYQAKYDLCDKKPKPDLIKSTMAGWAIPDQCPIKESSTFCYNSSNVIKLSMITQKMISLLSRAKLSLRVFITHDTGTSCFEVVSAFERIN